MKQLILEGGVFGHMSHLHDNPNLSFGEMKEILAAASAGEIEGTEKTDGQNLFLSYNVKDGTARAARNKGDIKRGGMTIEQLKQKFAGRGALEETFSDALESFEDAVGLFSPEDQNKIFGTDTNIFYNSEVQDPRATNVIKYDIKTLTIHRVGHAEYDRATGNPIIITDPDTGEEKLKDISASAEALTKALESIQGRKFGKDYDVKVNAMRELKALSDDEALKIAVGRIENLINSVGLSDNQTVGDYLILRVESLILDIADLPEDTLKMMISRVLKQYYKDQFDADKENIRIIISSAPEFEEQIRQIDAGHRQIVSNAIRPLEEIIHDFAVEVLRGLESVFVLDNRAEVERLRQETSRAITAIENSGSEEAMEILKTQMAKLKELEGVSTAAEGFVFDYNGYTYKFTGNFAPANQLLGLFKYGRGDVPPLQKLDEQNFQTLDVRYKYVPQSGDVRYNDPETGEELLIRQQAEPARSAAGSVPVQTAPMPNVVATPIMINGREVVPASREYTPPTVYASPNNKFKTFTIDSEGNLVSQGRSFRSLEETMELDEQASPVQRVVGVYPGRFQPMGRHHAKVFQKIMNFDFLDNAYAVTSDKVSLPKSPLNFQEKKVVMTGHGIPEANVVQSTNPYAPELPVDMDTTAVVFFVGEKDMKESPRFANLDGMRKDGTPAYLKTLDLDNLLPMSQHGYVAVAPHESLEVPGFGEMSGTTIRQALKDGDEQMFEQIMGWFDQGTYDMLKSKLDTLEEAGAYSPDFEDLISLTLDEAEELEERCQKGYKTHATRKTKKMFGRTYRNCVKAEGEEKNEAIKARSDRYDPRNYVGRDAGRGFDASSGGKVPPAGRYREEGKDPKKGTGKKPKDSGRRLYTDENPKDTVSVKFRTVQDIKDTLSKASFKSKSHKRQSQIINLIHQRARAAYQNAKDPKVKARLKKAFDYAKERKEASKKKTKQMQKTKTEVRKKKIYMEPNMLQDPSPVGGVIELDDSKLEEISAVGTGAVEGTPAAGGGPFPGLDIEKENEDERKRSKGLKEQDSVINEIANYLVMKKGVHYGQ